MWKVLIWCSNGVATAMFDKGLSLFAWFLYLFKLDSSTIEAFKKLRELTFVLENILINIISRQFDLKEKISGPINHYIKHFMKNQSIVICFFSKWALALSDGKLLEIEENLNIFSRFWTNTFKAFQTRAIINGLFTV